MTTPRLAPIDRMRGLVMVLMTSDHAAHVFYRDHVVLDSAFIPAWDGPLPTVPFLHRWLSHLCAPTFVFLAGTALALSITRKRDHTPASAIDRDLALRGVLLIALDVTLISAIWGGALGSRFVLQVLWAIGTGMVAMIPLRRLKPRALFVLGIALLLGHEALCGLALGVPGPAAPPPAPGLATAAILTGGFLFPDVAAVYPTVPWLAAMLLGYSFGARVAAGGAPLRPLCVGAVAGLATWGVVRGLDGYGNLLMTGVHDTPLRWLQLSKYPPSLAFAGLELALMCAILAGLFALERRRVAPSPNSILLVLGQTALFYYVLHIPLIEGVGVVLRAALGAAAVPGGIARTWLAVAATVALLYPACRWFRAFKRAHPNSLARLV